MFSSGIRIVGMCISAAVLSGCVCPPFNCPKTQTVDLNVENVALKSGNFATVRSQQVGNLYLWDRRNNNVQLLGSLDPSAIDNEDLSGTTLIATNVVDVSLTFALDVNEGQFAIEGFESAVEDKLVYEYKDAVGVKTTNPLPAMTSWFNDNGRDAALAAVRQSWVSRDVEDPDVLAVLLVSGTAAKSMSVEDSVEAELKAGIDVTQNGSSEVGLKVKGRVQNVEKLSITAAGDKRVLIDYEPIVYRLIQVPQRDQDGNIVATKLGYAFYTNYNKDDLRAAF